MIQLPKQKHIPLKRVATRKTSVVGHRGAAGLAPENTLAAFEAARQLNVDGVEFDVQRTKDGHLIVIHDEGVNRTTDGMGMVRHLTLAEIKAMDAGIWFDQRFAGERVATLEEMFDYMHGNDLLLFLEIKDPNHYPGIEAEIAAFIRKYDFVERLQVRSFDHASLRTFYEVAPEISVSELWYESIPNDNEVFFQTLDVLFALYTPENLAHIHARGQLATAWTVNNLEDAQNLINWGIDSLTTDFPDQILPLVE